MRYPGAVPNPNTGELISDAEVAEVDYTAFAGTKYEITARLIVRRVRDRNHPDELFPVWRYHQQHRTGHRRGHHTPPARDHRIRVRGPDR